MVAALRSYSLEGSWPAPGKRAFRYRRTDLYVHERVLAEADPRTARALCAASSPPR